MSDYVPTMDEIRAGYAELAELAYKSWNPGQPLPDEAWSAPFDRAMVEHDREVAAVALENLADRLLGAGPTVAGGLIGAIGLRDLAAEIRAGSRPEPT